MEETLLDFPHFHATLASQLFHCVPPFYFANRFKCFMANGKKFITANLQVNLWFGGKSRFCMGWASWRLGTNSGDTQRKSQRQHKGFKWLSPLFFLVLKEREPMNHVCNGNRTKRFPTASPSPTLPTAPTPHRPTGVGWPLHLPLLWLEKLHKSKRQSKYVFLCQLSSKG